MCYDRAVTREITQREVRNDSGQIMRELDRGESSVVARNSVPAGELRPIGRLRFVAAARAIEGLVNAAAIDPARFRSNVDRQLSQDPAPGSACLQTVGTLAACSTPRWSSNWKGWILAGSRLKRGEAILEPLPFDAAAARASGRLYARALAAGGKAHGQRAVDLPIAAVALSLGLPLHTRNPRDFCAA